MALSESGWTNEVTTPVCVNGMGPSSLKHIHSRSTFRSAGTFAAAQIMDSSSAVRGIETKAPRFAPCGGGDPGDRGPVVKPSCRGAEFWLLRLQRGPPAPL